MVNYCTQGMATRVTEWLGRTLVLLVVLVAVGAADARADSLVLGGGDAFGDDAPWFFRPPERSLSLSGDKSHVAGHTDGGGALIFGAPPGEALAVGRYTRALPDPAPGHPWMDQWFLGCPVFGEFEVRDIAFSPAGVPVRAWITFEISCNYPVRRSTHGELRVGYPAATGVEPVARVTRFPTAQPHAPPRVVPVRMYAGGSPVTFSDAAIAGDDADRFEVVDDECSGNEVAAGGSCDVRVAFDPAGAGDYSGALRLSYAGGVATSELEGTVAGGRTRLLLHSTGDEPVGAGWDWEFTPADSLVAARGNGSTWQEFWFDNPDNPFWDRFAVTLRGPWNDDSFVFAPGVYDHVLAPGTPVPTVYADAPWDDSGCDRERTRVEVLQADYDPTSQPRAFSAFFTIWCRGAGTLEGLVEYEATIAEPELPWPFDPEAERPVEEEPPSDEPEDELPPDEKPSEQHPAPVPVVGGAGGSVTGPRPRPVPARPVAPTAAPAPAPPQLAAVTAYGTCDRDRRRGLTLRRGTRGADRLSGTEGRDRILTGTGDDVVSGGAGDDCLDGGAGQDVLRGQGGGDVLVGGEGRDVLEGGPGDDVLVGGRGRDVLRCGAGDDLAVVSPGDRTSGCERRSTRRP